MKERKKGGEKPWTCEMAGGARAAAERTAHGGSLRAWKCVLKCLRRPRHRIDEKNAGHKNTFPEGAS